MRKEHEHEWQIKREPTYYCLVCGEPLGYRMVKKCIICGKEERKWEKARSYVELEPSGIPTIRHPTYRLLICKSCFEERIRSLKEMLAKRGVLVVDRILHVTDVRGKPIEAVVNVSKEQLEAMLDKSRPDYACVMVQAESAQILGVTVGFLYKNPIPIVIWCRLRLEHIWPEILKRMEMG